MLSFNRIIIQIGSMEYSGQIGLSFKYRNNKTNIFEIKTSSVAKKPAQKILLFTKSFIGSRHSSLQNHANNNNKKKSDWYILRNKLTS